MKNKNERRYCVYMLRFSATGEPFYIGKGLPGRPKQHYQLCNRSKSYPKNDIINNFDTYYTIEREGLTNDEANAYEKELIAAWGYENLTNQTRGGSGADGRTVTKETRVKQSEAMRGKSHSTQTRAKISEASSGENNPMYGKSHSRDSIARMCDTNVYKFQHKDWGRETCTQYELRMKYSLYHQNLSKVVNGKRKSTGGWSLVDPRTL